MSPTMSTLKSHENESLLNISQKQQIKLCLDGSYLETSSPRVREKFIA